MGGASTEFTWDEGGGACRPRVGGASTEFTWDEGGGACRPRVGGGSSEFTSDEGGGACRPQNKMAQGAVRSAKFPVIIIAVNRAQDRL